MAYTKSVPRIWRERIRKYRLLGGVCNDCGKVFYPSRRFCPRCGSGNVNKVTLPRTGKILYFTVIRNAPTEFKSFEPYILALIELDNGARILAQLTDIDLEEVYEGMPVEAVFRKYKEQGRDGVIEYGIKFRPRE